MSYRDTEHLRVLIANERRDRLALVAPIVAELGHEVIAREVEVDDVGAVTARVRPDVALVGLGESSEHALGLIEKIVQEAMPARPSGRARPTLSCAASPSTTTSRAPFGRRATIERAKGILMERHSIDETDAFRMLRDRSRSVNRKLVDIAAAVVDGHPLLPKALPPHRVSGWAMSDCHGRISPHPRRPLLSRRHRPVACDGTLVI